jgi:ankyrin repeat protein
MACKTSLHYYPSRDDADARLARRFRWAYCQLQELKTLDSYKPKYVRQVLRALSPNMDETYTRMLTRIKNIYFKEALTLLRWLAYARSPPNLGELVDAAITDPAEESSIDTSERGGLRDVMNILAGLVMFEEDYTVDTGSRLETGVTTNDTLTAGPDQGSTMFHSQRLTPDTRVRLAHFSIKEYLESERILGSKAHRFHLDSTSGQMFLAQSCLTYLRYYSVSSEKTSTTQDFETFPLLKYAAQSWFHHSALQQSDKIGREGLYLQLEKARYDWLLIYDPDAPSREPFVGPQYLCSAIYYASRLGLEVVAKELVASGATINIQGGQYGNSLQAACLSGHISTVHLLLDNGANINAVRGEYGTALQAALEGEHMILVRLLLTRGADVKVQGGWHGNALQAAAYKGFLNEVRLMLKRGADHTTREGWYGSAFQAAAAQGHADIVRFLFDDGADPDVKGGGFGSALVGASFRGHVKIVQLLLDMGADVNLWVGSHGTALYVASEQGRVEVVRLLLDNGALVEAQGGQLSTALQAAVDGGHTNVVLLLIDRGADVNARGGLFGFALQIAAFRGNVRILQLLLEKGADINALGGFFGDAHQAAGAGGHAGVTRSLQAAVPSNASIHALFNSRKNS